MHCRVRYLLNFDLKIRSGQVCAVVGFIIFPSQPLCQSVEIKEFCNRGRGLSAAILQATPPLQTSLVEIHKVRPCLYQKI